MRAEPLRVLLVEDSEDDAMLILRELRAHGHEPLMRRVETAAAMEEAIRSESWDVVLSDYTLPAFSAPDALALLREHDTDVPFIIISGAIGEETAARALKSGAHDFVMKGNLARLVPAIERELRDAAARREHRESSRALRERDELLRALIDASPAAILMVDRDRRVRIRNRAAEAMIGSAPEGSPGNVPFQEDGLRDTLERALAGESVQDERFTRTRSGQGRIELEVFAAPIRSASGGVPGAVIIAVDVTHRTELEEQLRQAQKMEAVGRLAGGVAHDFNNILTAISGYADFLLSDLPAEGSWRSDAEEIRKAAQRGSSLTRQLLTLSRREVVEPEHLDLAAVVGGMEKMLRRVVGEDLVIDVQTEPDLPVFADRGQLEQILMNLVVNSRDAMPEGGVLSIRSGRANAEAAGAAGEWVLLEVADTGAGIPQETLPQIFEPFYTTKEPGRGTGLGLSIVHGIVAQLGGRIAVDSELGRGTRLRVYLPAHETAGVSQSTAEAAPRLAADRAATVLVVEDDDAIRAMAVRALREAGFTVLEAQNGEAAVRRADEAGGAIDLLLMDVILPKGNGPRTARVIREKHGISRILFMSGYTGDAIAQQDGIDPRRNLLAKPFGQRELIARVNEMLARD